MTTDVAKQDWISLKRARELMGVGPTTLKRLVDAGRMPVRRVPGGHPRLRRSEVQSILAASTRPATDDGDQA
jgi:excisionase family DNA binding protein